MATFSFTENPVVNVLNHAHTLLPGIEKVIGIYYCREASRVKAKYTTNTIEHDIKVEDLIIEDCEEIVEKIRKSNLSVKWYKKDETPFEVRQKKKQVQMNVFQELENVVLSIGFYNEYDKKNDFLFFYFNHDFSNFGISDSNKVLTPENKKIIEFLLCNCIKTMIESSEKDNAIFNSYNENTKSLVKRYTQARKELERAKNNYGLSLIDLCKSYVKEYSESSSRFNYTLTEDALNRVKAYKGDIAALKTVIQNSVNYVDNLFYDSTETDIFISEDYLNFESIDAGTGEKVQNVQSYDKYSKTIILLDKLENAARDVIARNMDITGANVGSSCPTPITAPAITDALKKHRSKIIHLLNKYPDRWKILRTDFRPIKNVLVSRADLMEKTA